MYKYPSPTGPDIPLHTRMALEKRKYLYIQHFIDKILGIPLAKLFIRHGYNYVREVRRSLDPTYRSDFVEAIEMVTNGIISYPLYHLLSARVLPDSRVEISITCLGEEHYRRNIHVFTPPVDIIGYLESRNGMVIEFKDRIGYVFYVYADPRKDPSWFITDKKSEINDLIKIIQRDMESYAERLVRETGLRLPIAHYIGACEVEVKGSDFAYYHRRKHRFSEEVPPKPFAKYVVFIQTNKWKYIVDIYEKVRNTLLYFYLYPENTLV